MDLLAVRQTGGKGWRLMAIAAGLCLLAASALLLVSIAAPSALKLSAGIAVPAALASPILPG